MFVYICMYLSEKYTYLNQRFKFPSNCDFTRRKIQFSKLRNRWYLVMCYLKNGPQGFKGSYEDGYIFSGAEEHW